MYFKALIKHSAVTVPEVHGAMSRAFGTSAHVNEWAAASGLYAHTSDIAQRYIWGRVRNPEGIFGFIQEDSQRTLFWSEYHGTSDWAFSDIRANLETGIHALSSIRGRWNKQPAVVESEAYLEADGHPLGIRAEVPTWWSGFLQQCWTLVVLGVAYLAAVAYKLSTGSTVTSPETFNDPALFAFALTATILTIAAAVVRCWRRKLQVRMSIEGQDQ